MCQKHSHQITRSDFLKISGAALAGASLACGGGSKVLELTAVPTPVSPAAKPVATMAAGEFAETVLVNGNIVTIDAKRSTAKALAIKNGLIVFVGDDQAARNLADASTWRKVPHMILLGSLLVFGFFPKLLTEKIKPVTEQIVNMATTKPVEATAVAAVEKK